MILQAIAFYLLAATTIGAGLCVVSAKNPVHSVLFLITAFFSAAGLFVLLGAEFLAMLLVVVYVGAVAVLFLFVVMMLDVDFVQLREGFQRYLPVGATVGVVLLVELVMAVGGWKLAPGSDAHRFAPIDVGVENTRALGQILYTDYILLFQASGLVLLVAMIGAIVLTLRDRKSSRHQVIADQVNRMPNDTLVMVDVIRGAGVPVDHYLRPPVAQAATDAAPKLQSMGHGDHH